MAFEALDIDGTTLEGGGQLVRLSICLAALLQRTVHIKNIRGNRQGKRGLKGSHLEALRCLGELSDAEIKGAELGSSEIWFTPPRQYQGGRYVYEQREEQVVHLQQTKPGSVFLIVQAVLPFMLWSRPHAKNVRLIITGGTNVTMSPSAEYIDQVLIPVLRKIGINGLSLKVIERGWTHGPIEIGKVELTLSTLEPTKQLPAFTLADRGEIIGFDITILGRPQVLRDSISEKAITTLRKQFSNVQDFNVVVNDDSGHDKRLYLLIVAKGEKGERLGRDWLFDGKFDLRQTWTPSKKKGSAAKASKQSGPPSQYNSEAIDQVSNRLVNRVVQDITFELSHGACIDTHMADQLVVFAALSAGRSVVDAGRGQGNGTLHTQTVRWVVEQFFEKENKDERMFGVDDEGGRTWTDGLGLRSGEDYRRRRDEKEVEVEDELSDAVHDLGLEKNAPY